MVLAFFFYYAFYSFFRSYFFIWEIFKRYNVSRGITRNDPIHFMQILAFKIICISLSLRRLSKLSLLNYTTLTECCHSQKFSQTQNHYFSDLTCWDTQIQAEGFLLVGITYGESNSWFSPGCVVEGTYPKHPEVKMRELTLCLCCASLLFP